jgi:hypothetical protein
MPLTHDQNQDGPKDLPQKDSQCDALEHHVKSKNHSETHRHHHVATSHNPNTDTNNLNLTVSHIDEIH